MATDWSGYRKNLELTRSQNWPEKWPIFNPKKTVNQQFKPLINSELEHLKSTRNWKLRLTNSKTLCPQERSIERNIGKARKYRKSELNLGKTRLRKTCCKVKLNKINVGRNRPRNLRYLHTIRPRQPSFSLCPDPTILFKRTMIPRKWLKTAKQRTDSRNQFYTDPEAHFKFR